MSESGQHFCLDAQTYTLDVKSRIAIPAKFRNAVHDSGFGRFILTVGDLCLAVYSEDTWERILREEMTPEKTGMEPLKFLKYKRFVSFYTKTVETDGQGRITIPNSFLEIAKLGREVLITSNGNGLELWNPERLNEYLGSPEDYAIAYQMQQVNNTNFSIRSKVRSSEETVNTSDASGNPD